MDGPFVLAPRGGARTDLVQHLYSVTPNSAPPANTLMIGELGIELADPMRLWVGCPIDMDSTGRKLFYDSSAIVGGGGASVTVSDVAPLVPKGGDLWFDSVGTQLYVWYPDPNSSQWVIANSGMAGYLPTSGGTMTGPLTLHADPVNPLDAATKQYVDAHAAVGGPFLALAGGTMTGALILAADPAAAMQPVTLQYYNAHLPAAYVLPAASTTVRGGVRVDGTTITVAGDIISSAGGGASVSIGDTAPASPATGNLWFDSVNAQLYIRYADPNSSQWVVANNSSGLGDAPSDGTLYARRSASWASADAAIATAVAPAQHNVGRNLIHNALFNVVQRTGQPWTTSTAYLADRWTQAFSGTGTMSTSITTISDAARAQIGDEAAASALTSTFAGSSGTTDIMYIEQRSEGIRRTAGKTVTLSFWATGTAGLKLGLNLFQVFGSGGSPSAYVACAAQTITLLAGWVRYSATFSVPSAAGKVFGTNKDDALYIRFILSAGSVTDQGASGVQSGTINLWGVQCEVGSVATPLEKIDPQIDNANCRRFFQQGLLAYNATCYTTVAGQYVTATINLSPALRGPAVFSNITDYSSNLGTIGITLFSQNTIYVSAQATAAGICSMNHQFDVSADL